MTVKTLSTELVAKKEDPGGYEILVFYDLDSCSYLMCTRLPNWATKSPSIGDIGFLQAREFIAGEDTWYNVASGSKIPYNYTGVYFWDFIMKEEKINQELTLD